MYLSILIISRPVVASNNRGESVGNVQCLQKITTPQGTRTVLSGYAIKRAVRDRMQATGSMLWRKSVEPSSENPAGYEYGVANSPTMKGAEPASAAQWDDTLLFGYMVQAKDNEEGVKSRGNVEISDAISTTPYDGDMGFAQGLKAGEPLLNPFSFERHLTRYQYVINVDLDGMSARPKAVLALVEALRGLRVGGSHGSHATEIIPAYMAWRLHPEPGCGGLYAGILDVSVEDISLNEIHTQWEDLGVAVETAGSNSLSTVAEGLTEILTSVQEYFGGEL